MAKSCLMVTHQPCRATVPESVYIVYTVYTKTYSTVLIYYFLLLMAIKGSMNRRPTESVPWRYHRRHWLVSNATTEGIAGLEWEVFH